MLCRPLVWCLASHDVMLGLWCRPASIIYRRQTHPLVAIMLFTDHQWVLVLCLQASMPKQYLPLLGQPIAMYSMQTLCSMPEIGELVIVCDPSYQASASSSWVRFWRRELDDTKLLESCNCATFRKLRYCGCKSQEVFQEFYDRLPQKLPLKFAQPGAERQDSVFNGFEVGLAECVSTDQTLSQDTTLRGHTRGL